MAPISTQSTETKAKTQLAEQILPSMVLAPSAHNTQPWHFDVNADQIDIYVDWQRHLPISDPTHRQLLISIGCAVANAKVAAKYWNYDIVVTNFPEGQANDQPVVRLSLSLSKQKGDTADLFTSIEARRTDRTLYDQKPLTANERLQLTQDLDDSALLIEDKDRINKIAALTEEATVNTLSDEGFKNELSHWVRNNWTEKPDGMPGYAMGMPAPVSLISSFLVKRMPIHKQEGPKTRQQIESSSLVAIISTDGDAALDWLHAGEVLEMLWLRANTAGLAASPLAATIEAGKEIRQQLQEITISSKHPQSIIRLGHSHTKNLRSTPRRTIEDCLK